MLYRGLILALLLALCASCATIEEDVPCWIEINEEAGVELWCAEIVCDNGECEEIIYGEELE